MSGPELAVLACGPAGEPKAKASSQASNVLHRQHHRSSHPAQSLSRGSRHISSRSSKLIKRKLADAPSTMTA